MLLRSTAVFVLALSLEACSSNGSSGFDSGNGGAASSGGSAGSGATVSSGGSSGNGVGGAASGSAPANSGASTGSGGIPSSGGRTSIGGAQSSGGASTNAGSGGATSSGGATGSGGATSGGGATSSGGANTGAGGANTGAGGASAGTWWKPAKNTTFYWDLQNAPPNNTRNVGAYDIDGWGNDAKETALLHAKGIKVVCYMDAGTYEPGRPDTGDFPTSLKGADVEGWPGELWLDVRPSGPNYAKLQSIMMARFKVCQQKGFDAIEPDNIDSYQNSPGFATKAADQLAYNQWLATTAHGLGLAIFQKNDLDQVKALEPSFDGILDEECNKYSECDTLAPYTAAGKPAWDAEYTDDGETTAKFCDADIKANIAGALFNLDLDGSLFEPCTNDVGLTN
ncbi:MAG TPA: endo alpha-1,4 polygalactosaminidase [Polyangiaceae bacterium]|jgi:hypothetical protein|nr:endo alpha-1,4 polygalactosaminidase [Polyangiaceae bacterium]